MARIPSYRLHRPSGLAVVTLNGKDHYLGPHGTPESRRAYDRLVGGWIAAGRRPVDETPREPTVADLADAFAAHARTWYVKRGRPTSQQSIVLPVLAALAAAYGGLPAREFGPTKLVELRESWVAAGSSRSYANRRAGVVKAAFRWGAEREIVPGGAYQSLRAVRGLARGRTKAHESPPVGPVPIAHVEAVLAVLGPRDEALVRLQLATGMRPGEVVRMRPMDIDRSGAVWAYTPAEHKTEHRGRARVVYLGPTARAVLGPLLEACPAPGRYLFPARVADRPGRRGHRHLGPLSYYQVIRRACPKAGVPHWHPNQLRHNAAKRVRSMYGIEAARVVLGHSDMATSLIYAEADEEKARRIAEELG